MKKGLTYSLIASDLIAIVSESLLLFPWDGEKGIWRRSCGERDPTIAFSINMFIYTKLID